MFQVQAGDVLVEAIKCPVPNAALHLQQSCVDYKTSPICLEGKHQCISNPLHTHCNAHASSNAQGCHTFVPSCPLECMQQGDQHSAA